MACTTVIECPLPLFHKIQHYQLYLMNHQCTHLKVHRCGLQGSGGPPKDGAASGRGRVRPCEERRARDLSLPEKYPMWRANHQIQASLDKHYYVYI